MRLLPAVALLTVLASTPAGAQVQLNDGNLVRDGVPAPFLFGAETQYFRARGGPARNVPRAEVERLWDLLLDRLQEAHMNAVSFYIPWDFHEPVEGTFDFDGTLDLDGDGHPDYPSRDVKGFLRKVAERGFKYVMVRPGPYINAEWGPVGFGAVPLWFLERYPEALAVTRTPGRAKTATFAHPVFREHTRRWFAALYDQVLKDYIGPGKPIVLLQLDNETNYFWDSAYERDFSELGQQRYHEFLARTYGGDVSRLNGAYGSRFADIPSVSAPAGPADASVTGFGWRYDWFNWHDEEIRDYFRFLRATWEGLGVKEPSVLFTRCDSFNASDAGLLPRLDFGQDDRLALSTLNIYPKTYGTQADSTMNTPMKGAHDATLLAASHRQYYGTGGQWVMATETVGGWFPPTEVSLATREHTYGSLLGSGVKAMMIYYFHEGYNWNGLEREDSELHFDAPLDKDLKPRPAFELLQRVGAALAGGLGDDLKAASPVRAPVLLAHDSWTQYPVADPHAALDAASASSAALYGLFRAAGAMPDVGFVDRMSARDLAAYRLVVWRHPGYIGGETLAKLQDFVSQGGELVVIGDSGGDVAVKAPTDGPGRVVSLWVSPAEGWNDDRYAHLGETAGKDLATAASLLAQAGVAPLVTVAGNPFVHAWVSRREDGALLLFVENFLKEPQTVSVSFDQALSAPLGQSVTLQPRLLASGAALPARSLPAATLKAGVAMPVSADGLDVWMLSKGP